MLGEHSRAAARAIREAKEDPLVVKECIRQLRDSGEIEPDDLSHLERIADRWIAIAQANLKKGKQL